MPIFGSKDKENNRSVNFSCVDGLPGYASGDAVNATINLDQSILFLRARVFKRPEIKLYLDKITSVSVATETEIREKSKNVIGRAAIGTLLLGPLGAVVGGMSGVGSKKKKEIKSFLFITYLSSDISEKTIVLEIVGASLGWNKFVADLKKATQGEVQKEIVL